MHVVIVQYFIWGEDKRPSRVHFSGMREWQLACLLSCRNIYPPPKGDSEHLRGQHSYSSYNPLPIGIRFRLSIFLLCQEGQKTQFWSCFCLPDCSCRPTPSLYTTGPTQAYGHCYSNANVREGPQRLPSHMWQNHMCYTCVWMCTLMCLLSVLGCCSGAQLTTITFNWAQNGLQWSWAKGKERKIY